MAISAVAYFSLNPDLFSGDYVDVDTETTVSEPEAVEDVIAYSCITKTDPHSCRCPDDSVQPILVSDDGKVQFGPKSFAPDELELL